MLINGILLMSSAVGCASYINETHYFRSYTEDKDHVPNNYYKVVVDGYTFGSSARYLAGYFDETAVDSYFSEFSQPTNGKLPQSLSSDKPPQVNSGDDQLLIKRQLSSERIEPINPVLDLTPKNVYAIDCDEVNTVYDPPKGHSYFRSGKTKGTLGVVFDHIFDTMLTGRVFPSDEFRKSSILALPKSRKSS